MFNRTDMLNLPETDRPLGGDVLEYGVKSSQIVGAANPQEAAFVYVGKPAWHVLGAEMPEGTLPSQAFAAAGLNELTTFKDVLYRKNEAGDFVQVKSKKGQPNKVALVLRANRWSKDEQTLGMVDDNYEIIPPIWAGELLDRLGKFANVDCAGALYGGRAIFCTMRGEWFNIYCNGQNNEHRSFFVWYEDRLPGNAVQLFHTDLRACCANTTRRMQTRNDFSLNVTHNKGAQEMSQWAINILAQMASQAKAEAQATQMLAEKPIGVAQVSELTEVAFPDPTMPTKVIMADMMEQHNILMPDGERAKLVMAGEASMKRWEEALDRQKKLRDFTLEVYAGHPTMMNAQGTAYGALQAVTYTCDHYNTRTGGDGAIGTKIAQAVLVGDRVGPKMKAWEFLVNLKN